MNLVYMLAVEIEKVSRKLSDEFSLSQERVQEIENEVLGERILSLETRTHRKRKG